tara:strand:- start:471 stop:1265 length:795 start_codon:yes stop_codon:yes gene_type:complete
MVRKIKTKKVLTEEEKEALEREKAMEAAGLQDEFQAKGFEMVDWMQEHAKLVMIGIGAVVVCGVVVAGVTFAGSQANLDASSSYENALAILDKSVDTDAEESTGSNVYASEADRDAAAMAALEKVASDHSGSKVALLATLRAGQLAASTGQKDKALALYQTLESKTNDKDALRPVVLSGLAFALEASGDNQKAASTFERLVSLPGDVQKDLGLWQAARLFHGLGKTDVARQNAEKLINQYPTSALKKDAEGLLAQLPKAAEAKK